MQPTLRNIIHVDFAIDVEFRSRGHGTKTFDCGVPEVRIGSRVILIVYVKRSQGIFSNIPFLVRKHFTIFF